MAILSVGSGQQYQTIASAVAASKDGDTIQVQAGTYVNDFSEITKKITIEGVGGLAHIVATASPPNGKAILTTDTDVHLDHVELSGASVPDGNGAGIRYQAGNLLVTNSYIHGNQDGILGNADPNGSITIDGSEIAGNGSGDGRTHNLYIGDVASFTLTNSYVHDANVGHEVKSRAAVNTISGNRIQNNATGTGSYLIDLPNGGVDTVSNNVLQKGPLADNSNLISFGEEGDNYSNSSLSVQNNTIVSDLTAHIPVIVVNDTSRSATVSSNTLWGVAATSESGTVTVSGNTAASSRPVLSTQSLFAPGYTAPTTIAPTTTSTSAPTLTAAPTAPSAGGPVASTTPAPSVDLSANGAVTPSGHVLTVGAGEQFSTVAAAVAAAQDGDTIDVDAGTYVNDGAVIDKNLIIQGVNGVARFVSNNGYPLWHQAIFITSANVTLKNLDLSGAAISAAYDGNAAGVRMHGGNLTLIGDTIHDNQNGVLATPDHAGGTVTIEGSEISHNGQASGAYAGLGYDVNVGGVSALAVDNSYIHDPVGGESLRSRAAITVVTNSRVGDGASGTGQAAIDLPDGGVAVLANSLIEKGANGQTGPMIRFGEEASPANSRLQLFDDLLSNDGGAQTTGIADYGSFPVGVSDTGLWNLDASALAPSSAAVTGLSSLSAAPNLADPAAIDTDATGVFRFYDQTTGTHFLTGSVGETVSLLVGRPDLTFEGLGLSAVSADDANAVPVFRFFDTNNGTHFFTTSAAERDQVEATRPDLTLEQTSFYEHATAMAGDVPVYRFFDTTFGTHFYTDSASERATTDATRPDLVDEGIAFYSPKPV